MKNKTKSFCLFQGRHEIPGNPPAICTAFNFETMEPIPTPVFNMAINHLVKGGSVTLYVTGLTPALTFFLSQAAKVGDGSVVLMHFNRDLEEYVPQKFM